LFFFRKLSLVSSSKYGGIEIKEDFNLILKCGSLKLRIKVRTRIQTFWEMLDPNPDPCSIQVYNEYGSANLLPAKGKKDRKV
jgi:hypothetical protein